MKTENKFFKYGKPVFGIIGLLLIIIGHFVSNSSFAVLGGLIIFVAVSWFLKVKENMRTEKAIVAGSRGEQQVSNTLKEELPDEYYVINDFNVVGNGGKKAQIDHLLIGTNGFFVIETKAYYGRLEGKATDEKLKRIKEFRGRHAVSYLTNPIMQNEYHIEILKEYLQKIKIEVKSIVNVVVFTSYMIWDIEGDEDYNLLRPSYLYNFVTNYVPDESVSKETIEKFLAAVQSEFKRLTDTHN